MENIKAKTTSTTDNSRFVKLIDGTDYYWDNDKNEMIICGNGLTSNHSDIVCSNDGDGCVIKRVWIKDKEISANTMWCRKTKKALDTIVDDEFSWWSVEKDVEVEYKIRKTYIDGIIEVYIEKYKNNEKIDSDITKVGIGIIHKEDTDKIIEESFLSSDIDEDVRQAYLNLQTDEEKKTFRENWFKMKTTSNVVNTIKMETDRIIKAADIDKDAAVNIMRASAAGTITTDDTVNNFVKLREKLKKQVQNEYIVKRARTSNGQLDRLLTIKEMKEIDAEVERIIESDKKLQVSADMSKINGVYDSLNNRNLDSQIAYEVKKEAYCNVFGYTPESFDEYMNEIFRLQEEKLAKGEYAQTISGIGGDGFEETTTIKSMLNNSDVEDIASAKLVRVEGWDDLADDQKPLLYQSELLLAVIEEDKREMDPERLKKLREEDPNGMRLYDLMNDSIYSLERWQKVRRKRKGDKNEVTHTKRSVAAKTDVEKFMEERKAARDEKKASGELVNKISAEKPKEPVKEEPKKSVDDVYDDIMGDDITEIEIKGGNSNGGQVQANNGGRESRQDGSSVTGRGSESVRGETYSDSKDVVSQSGNNDSGRNDRGGTTTVTSEHNESAQNSTSDSGQTGTGTNEYEDVLDDYDDIEIIEIGDENNGECKRPGNTDTTRIDGDAVSSDNRNISEYSGESNRISVSQTEHNEYERFNIGRADQDSMAGDWNGVVGSNEIYDNSRTGNIEVVENDRPNTVRDFGSSDSETQYGNRSSEVQGNSNHEEPESEEEIIEVISPENRISEESIDTIGRRVYSENTTSISNIKINEVNENEFRENNRYSTISNNDNTNSNDIDTDTNSNYIRSERGDTNIQSEEVSKESDIKRDSERCSSEQLPSGNREIEMAERTEIKMLNITSDGNIILTNGKIVTPEEFKQMKEEGALTVEEMLQDDEPEEKIPNRVRITDDNLVNMFKLITAKKAVWNQKDDMAIISIDNDSTEYVYEPVNVFINKYTEFAINNATTSIATPKLKDVEEIKENIDTLKQKVATPKNKKVKDRLEEYKKLKEQKDEAPVVADTEEVEVIEVTNATDVTVVEPYYDDDKFKEYDRPLEAKVTRVPDSYFLDRHRELKGKLDEISGVFKGDGDISLLRNVNKYERIKEYRDSSTYSRDLYLPNSNYVVKVRRLKRRDKLSWMMTFLEGVKDAKSAEDIARPDLISTVFDQLEFPFDAPVSEEDFLKNLHQTDVTLLMTMFALVNLPEDKDGRVIISDISKFVCDKCGKSAFLKQPMSIDIKDEFFAIYPKDLWLENYSTYKQARYATIQKAYRSSKVGARFKITDDTPDEPFKTDIIISRPTVYKSNMVESLRLDVAYQLRLEELSGMLDKATSDGDVPDEILKAIDYMSDRSFREVRNRVLMLDDIDLTKDPEEIPESSREQYKGFQDEYRIIEFIMSEIQNTDTKLAATFNSCQYIDSLIFVDKESGKPIHIIDHTNLYDMVDSIPYLSDTVVNAINKKIEELKNGYNGISTNIVFTPEEFKGKFRWDDVYQVINGKVLTEKEFLQRIQQEGGYTDNDMKEVAELRKKYKENLEDGKCVCGNDKPWVLNWIDLLFFSTAKILGQTISTEPDKSYLL